MIDVLSHAATSLDEGDTNDPANVSGPIDVPSYRDRTVTISRISKAAAKLQQANDIDEDDEDALDNVAALFAEVHKIKC